jgi:hypothetical protein
LVVAGIYLLFIVDWEVTKDIALAGSWRCSLVINRVCKRTGYRNV